MQRLASQAGQSQDPRILAGEMQEVIEEILEVALGEIHPCCFIEGPLGRRVVAQVCRSCMEMTIRQFDRRAKKLKLDMDGSQLMGSLGINYGDLCGFGEESHDNFCCCCGARLMVLPEEDEESSLHERFADLACIRPPSLWSLFQLSAIMEAWSARFHNEAGLKAASMLAMEWILLHGGQLRKEAQHYREREDRMLGLAPKKLSPH